VLVATFNDSTGWAGKTLRHDGAQYVLEGVGPVTAQQIVAYDEAGQIDWASDGARAWVYGRTVASARTHERRTAVPLWGWLLGAAIVVAVIVAIGTSGSFRHSSPAPAGDDRQGAGAGASASAPAQAAVPAPAKTVAPSSRPLITAIIYVGGGEGTYRDQSPDFMLQGGRQVVTITSQPVIGATGSPEMHFMTYDAAYARAVDGIDLSEVGTHTCESRLPAGSYFIFGYSVDCSWTVRVEEER